MKYRSQTRGADANKLDSIISFLQRYHLVVHREVREGREVDIKVKFPKGDVDIQLDGLRVHGTIETEQNQKTRKRNVDLTNLKQEWRIVDEALCEALGISKEKMTLYMAYEGNMHLLAKHDCQL